jgi:uncharacterized protein YggT (Ycf19 family)
MVDNKLELEEAQRAANYEAIKSEVKSEVGAEIAAEAERPKPSEAHVVEAAADRLRAKAVNEVSETESEIERGRLMARISQVVDYIFFLIYGLLTIRLLLELFNARESAGFVQFIKSITNPFYAPFRSIVADPSKDGFTLSLSIVIALVVYMLLHLAINNLLRIFAHRKTAV